MLWYYVHRCAVWLIRLCLISTVLWIAEEGRSAIPTVAPTNLSAVQEGPRQTLITWTGVSGFGETYQVDMTTPTESAKRTIVTTTSFTARFMKANIPYTITVRSKTADGLGPPATIIFTPPPTPVTGPIPDLTIVPAATMAQFRWSPVPNAMRYVVSLRDVLLPPDRPVPTRIVRYTPIWISGLIPGRQYAITIRAEGDDASFVETTRLLTAFPLVPPRQSPGHLTVLGSPTGGIISWTRVPNASAYTVEIGTTPETVGQLKTLTATTTTLPLTGLASNQTHYVRVTPINPAGAGPKSLLVSWRTEQAVTATPVITAVQPGPHQLLVTWTPAPGSARTTIVYTRMTDHQGAQTCGTETPTPDLSRPELAQQLLNPTRNPSLGQHRSLLESNPTASDHPITNATSPQIIGGLQGWHQYAIRAFSETDEGKGPLSPPVTGQPIGAPRTAPIVTAHPSVRLANALKLTWPPVNDADPNGYIVYTQPVTQSPSGFDRAGATAWPERSIDTTISGLETGMEYWVSVSATNKAGEGCLSEVLKTTTLDVPGPVGPVLAQSLNGAIELSWPPAANAIPTGYTITYAAQNDFADSPVHTLPNQASPARITGLVNGVPQNITVKATNAAGAGRAGLAYAAAAAPLSQTWRVLTTARVARAGHEAALLPTSGDVLHIGGYAQPDSGIVIPVAAVDRFQPDPDGLPGTWVPDQALFPGRSGHALITRPTGELVVIGGHDGRSDSATVQEYDPVRATWTTLPSLRTPRSYHTATVLADGTILVLGGLSHGLPLASGERYDPATRSWQDILPMSIERAHHTATLLFDRTVLVAGGITPAGYLSDATRYDPEHNSWSPLPALSLPRAFHTATRLYNGDVLLIGGAMPDVNPIIERFNQVDKTWNVVAPLPEPRYAHQATLLHDGSVLVTGGHDAGMPLASTWQWAWPSGAWIPRPPLPDVRAYHSAVTLTTGQVLVLGGHTSNGPTNHAALYR